MNSGVKYQTIPITYPILWGKFLMWILRFGYADSLTDVGSYSPSVLLYYFEVALERGSGYMFPAPRGEVPTFFISSSSLHTLLSAILS